MAERAPLPPSWALTRLPSTAISLPASITRCRASEPAVQSRRDGQPCQARQLRGGTALHPPASPAYSVPVPDPLLLEANVGLPPSAPVPLDAGNRRLSIRSYLHPITSPRLRQPFHWVQHRRGLSNTDMSFAAKAHHSILPTCLAAWVGNLGQIVVDIILVMVQCPLYYNGIISSSSPYVRTSLLPRHATGQRVHTADATIECSPTSRNACQISGVTPENTILQRLQGVAEVGDVETREMASCSDTNTPNLGVRLPCPVCQSRYRHLEDIIHVPLLGTEHTNLHVACFCSALTKIVQRST